MNITKIIAEELQVKEKQVEATIKLIDEGKPAEEIILEYYKEHKDCVFICDEIGNGIVPMDEKEREYRERVGRLLIELAKEADVVERVMCGIGQRIK